MVGPRIHLPFTFLSRCIFLPLLSPHTRLKALAGFQGAAAAAGAASAGRDGSGGRHDEYCRRRSSGRRRRLAFSSRRNRDTPSHRSFLFIFSFLSSAYKFCSTIFSTNKIYLRDFYSLECWSYVFLPKFLNIFLFKIFIQIFITNFVSKFFYHNYCCVLFLCFAKFCFFLDFCSQFLSSTYKFCSTIFCTNKIYLRYFYSLECLSYVFLPKFLNNCLFKIFIPKGFVITFFCYQKVYNKLFFLSLNSWYV